MLGSSALAWSTVAFGLTRRIDAQSPASDRHRVATSVALDAGTVPDAFSNRCGTQGAGSLGVGGQVAMLVRPHRWLIVQADAHATTSALQSDCVDVLPYRRFSADSYEERRRTQLPAGTPGFPLAMTMARLGVETPAGPLVRLTAGAGAI